MSDQPFDNAFEQWVARTARQMPYPPTPDVAHSVAARVAAPLARRPSPRRLVLAALGMIVVLAFGVVIAVPSVRAAVLEIIRIGAVRILVGPPTPTPTPVPTQPGAVIVPATATLNPIPTEPNPLLTGMAGLTTLADVRQHFGHPIKLPAYPPDLGQPDRVYRQYGNTVILVWLDPRDPGKIRLSMDILTDDIMVYKQQPKVIQETQVNGQRALWLEGPYPISYGRDVFMMRLVEGHALVWLETDTQLTYRLETDLPLDEAIKIAESLR